MSNTNSEDNRNGQMPTGMDNREAKKQRLLREGRKRYLIECQKQIDSLAALAGRCARDESAPGGIYRIAHAMKGSAPMFGLGKIGTLAEQLVELWREEDDSPGPAAEEKPADAALADRTAHLVRMLQLEHDIQSHEQHAAGPSPAADFRGLLNTSDCRLLVIDDDDVLRDYIVRRLALEGYRVDDAADVESAQKLLREGKYDLCTLDLMMMPRSGYELFSFLKEDPSLKWMPLIVLSGLDDTGDKVRCFQYGADDYITKPFQYEEFAARVYNLLLRSKNFEAMAFRDPLTGAFNRRYFDQQLDIEMQRVRRSPAPLSLVFVDIDRFKSINDNYGHHIGDIVLQGLAHTFQQNLRSSDLLARYGGEEFVVIMPGTAAGEACARIQAILEIVRSEPIARFEGREYSVTFSAGAAEWTGDMTVKEWIGIADEAMYRAKQQGRNRILLGEKAGQTAPAVAVLASFVRKIVIADDDEIVRSMIAARLKSPDIEIAEARSEQEASELLLGGPVHVVIVNHGGHSAIDGFSLLRGLRADSRFVMSRHKILLLLSRKTEADMKIGTELGADDCMVKPFSMVELELRVKRLLEMTE